MNIQTVVLSLGLLICFSAFGQYQYPFENGAEQPFINSLIGEERCGDAGCIPNRNKRCRFHLGLDMPKDNDTRLYSVELQTEILRNLAGAPAVGHFGYYHASLANGFSYGDDVPSRTWFAIVGQNHLHLQQHITNLSTNLGITSWTAN